MSAKVLVIEDNRALAENLAELFEDLGATVEICTDLDGALSRATESPPDLSVVDVQLPGGRSGLDALPRLRELAPHGEVLLMTGSATLDTAIEAVRQGVFAYVQKPFDPADLVALSERALAQVALRKERQALERELASSEALYRGVVDTVDQLILGVDAEGRIELANRYASDVTGRPTAELVGMRFIDVIAGPAQRRAAARALSEAQRGTTVRDRELALPAAVGVRLVRWTLMSLSTGEVAMVLAAGVDVTERVALERRTAQSEALATMGALTAGLAHEIRNPLNAAKLQLEVLSRSAARVSDASLSETIRERVEVVKNEIGRLSTMLDEFLALARPRGIESQPFEVHRVLDEVRHLHGPVAAQAGIRIDVSADKELSALGDSHKVKQVLVNLVANAIEAIRSSGTRGHIDITAAPAPRGFIQIRVSDTGPGIPPETAERLFEPFYTTKEAGTGLGLAVAKRIVEMHGGQIAIAPRARPERGTTVTFTLPTSG